MTGAALGERIEDMTGPKPRIQAALNGPVTPEQHPNVPISAQELAVDAVRCAEAGVFSIHLHPRDADGNESLEAGVVNRVVTRVRDASGLPVGVSTGEWIEPDLELRLSNIGQWSAPDFASVNLGEAGAAEVMSTLLSVDIGIEAGLVNVEDVARLQQSGYAARVTRVLIEPWGVGPADAVAVADAMCGALDQAGISAPRLLHGFNDAAWIFVVDALRRGFDTRIGLEDVLLGPTASPAVDNASLVRCVDALRG